MILPAFLINDFVRDALKEDLGHGFDVTSQFVLSPEQKAGAVFVARGDGVLAGVDVARSVFSVLCSECLFIVHSQDGASLKAGDLIATVEGKVSTILAGERTALNMMTHMSGISTLTGQYVSAIEGTGAKICDTRKTLPGLRLFQKYAVHVGGGVNHRFGLDDSILIKDNHIAFGGGVLNVLDQAVRKAGHTLKVEIEVDTLAQLEEVLKHGGVDIVLLDNMDVKTLQKAVQMSAGKVITEASGGVTLETVREIAETGVDYISVGALTHSAPALDVGLDIKVLN